MPGGTQCLRPKGKHSQNATEPHLSTKKSRRTLGEAAAAGNARLCQILSCAGKEAETRAGHKGRGASDLGTGDAGRATGFRASQAEKLQKPRQVQTTDQRYHQRGTTDQISQNRFMRPGRDCFDLLDHWVASLLLLLLLLCSHFPPVL